MSCLQSKQDIKSVSSAIATSEREDRYPGWLANIFPSYFLAYPYHCECTADYRGIEAKCGKWDANSNEKYCYLAGGLQADICPDAKKSSAGQFYWTTNEVICRNAGYCKFACKFQDILPLVKLSYL